MKCAELDARIEQYRFLAAAIDDDLTQESALSLIAGVEADRRAMHAEALKSGNSLG